MKIDFSKHVTGKEFLDYIKDIDSVHEMFVESIESDNLGNAEYVRQMVSAGCAVHYNVIEHFLVLLPKDLRDGIMKSMVPEMIRRMDAVAGDTGVLNRIQH